MQVVGPEGGGGPGRQVSPADGGEFGSNCVLIGKVRAGRHDPAPGAGTP